MKLPSGAPGSRILSVGEYRPARVVTNEEICQRIDSSDAWIRERTGIITRRFASDDETVAGMAAAASSKALADAGIEPDDVDLVVVATITHPYQTPAASSEVQHLIGASRAGAFDLGAACAGFCYALSVADAAIRSGTARYVVVAGSERMTDFIDPTDRGMAFLFGDGAGAVVVGPADRPGIGPVVWGSDGSQAAMITQEPTYLEVQRALAEGKTTPPVALRMAGQSVFRWAVTQMAPVARRALEAAGVDVGELAAFIPHQANLRIVESLAKSLGLGPNTVIARDIETQGNTSSASIPLALAALLEEGAVESGQYALLIGFGAGLTYAAQVIEIP
ncbi:MAG: ketoacyl-ACP synthase III [Acidothermus sp.]|nr:ketoacyl-ACP synthase III [Acidothermus sp.]MCL6538744.1 ketoacyl-ACP synthase III [Acidothermus sp.]